MRPASPCTWTLLVPTPCSERLLFPHWGSWHPWRTSVGRRVWVHFWFLGSVPSACVSVLMPVTHCFDCCSFAASFEIRKHESPSLASFFWLWFWFAFSWGRMTSNSSGRRVKWEGLVLHGDQQATACRLTFFCLVFIWTPSLNFVCLWGFFAFKKRIRSKDDYMKSL